MFLYYLYIIINLHRIYTLSLYNLILGYIYIVHSTN
jgi:hypothetical protein